MAFNIDITLGIVSLAITAILGYVGIKHTLKYRKKTEIFFLKITSISLIEDIVKNLEDIEIKFRGAKISENLVLFKGAFFNSGNVDIEKRLIHKPLEIELPENYQWIDFKMAKRSEGLEINFTVDSNKIVFGWDLFKEGEYFTFDSLVEYKSSEESQLAIDNDLVELLKINQRITDLKKVKKEYSIPKPTFLSTYLFAFFLFGSLAGSGIYISYENYFFPTYRIYSEAKIGKRKSLVELNARQPSEIVLTDNQDHELLIVKADSISKVLIGKMYVKTTKPDYLANIFITISSIVALGIFTTTIALFIKSRKRYHKFKNIEIEY